MAKPATPSAPVKVIPGASIGTDYVCFPCKRKFPSDNALSRHKQRSDVHRRMMDKEEDRMRKRKNEIIGAVQSVRHHLAEADEALETQANVSESVQKQRMLLDLQLQQLLKEYAQAQSIIEDSRDIKEAKKTGMEKPTKFHEVTVGKLAITAGAASWQGNKDFQEDRYVIDIELESPEGHRVAGFACLDGHSGSLCVDHVAEKLGPNIQQCLSVKKQLTEETLTQAVQEACVLTDDDFLKTARQLETLDGSTMVLALIYPEDSRPGADGVRAPGSCRMLVANIGDSRAVLCTSRQLPGSTGGLMALPMSVDHKPNREDETARIESKGGVVDFQGVWRVFTPGSSNFGGQTIARWGLAVSRAFGDLLLKEPEKYDCAGVTPGGLVIAVPEIQVVDLNASEDRFLVMASDGIWDVQTSEEAVATCAEQEDVTKAAKQLLNRTYSSNSDDNITVVVVSWREID